MLEATQPSASTSTSTTGGTMSSFDEVTGLAPEHPAAVALREGGHAQLSFGFSAGGLIIDCTLLFPWTSFGIKTDL